MRLCVYQLLETIMAPKKNTSIHSLKKKINGLVKTVNCIKFYLSRKIMIFLGLILIWQMLLINALKTEGHIGQLLAQNPESRMTCFLFNVSAEY